jgi:uncharacterized protein (TIGR02466 family)
MSFHEYFPTLVYTAALQRSGARKLNDALLRECERLRLDDSAGRRWSAENYPGGYTSYASAHRLQGMSPTFEMLERKLRRHVQAFAAAADWDLDGRTLSMTDCWVNIMPQRTVHVLHLHPLSTLSGTYYVRVPRGSPGLRKAGARASNRSWMTVPAEAGKLILFESWLRHEVAPNPVRAERVSISFNYNWF